MISLWKGATIDGTVFDERNEPVVGMVVSAVRRTSDGVLTSGPTTRTDDRGAFHISALSPGASVVVVPQTQVLLPASTAISPTSDPLLSRQLAAAGAPPPSQSGVVFGGVVSSSTAPVAGNALQAASQSRHVYQSTFHPAATTLEKARVVMVTSGEAVTGVDVQLAPVSAVSVSGTLLDVGMPVANFGVRLLPADTKDGSEVLEVSWTATDVLGKFTFPLVPEGQYRLSAQRRTRVPSAVAPNGAVTYADPPSLNAQAFVAAATQVGAPEVGSTINPKAPEVNH